MQSFDRRAVLAVGAGALLLPRAALAVAPVLDTPFIGKATAPATMTVWFDFRCPFCKVLWTQSLPGLVTTYVHTGRLKIRLAQIPLSGEATYVTAVVGRTVWHLSPTAYAQWVDAMYNDQEHSIAELTMSILGIAKARLQTELQANAQTFRREVLAELAEARRVGIEATPAIRTGDDITHGAQNYDALARRIDKLLTSA